MALPAPIVTEPRPSFVNEFRFETAVETDGFRPPANVKVALFVNRTYWSLALLDVIDTDGVAVTLSTKTPLVAWVANVPDPSMVPPLTEPPLRVKVTPELTARVPPLSVN